MSEQNSVGEGYREARNDGIDCKNPQLQLQRLLTGEWIYRLGSGPLVPGIRYRVPIEPEWYYLVKDDIMGAEDQYKCDLLTKADQWVPTGDSGFVGLPFNPKLHRPRRRRVVKPAEPQPKPCLDITPAQALDALRDAMQKDSDFAWTWHSNIAMVASDAGAPIREANERAADFMFQAFGVDMRASAEWGFVSECCRKEVDTVPPADHNAATHDPVYQPAHYTQGPIECVDWVRLGLTPEEYRGWLKGTSMGYLFRERLKGGDEDLAKAAQFLTFNNRPSVTITKE